MKAKTTLIALLAISTLFLLNSCWTSTDSHSMDDWTNMEGTTHDESIKNEKKSNDDVLEMHSMDNGTTMSGTEESMSWIELDEENIVWDWKIEEMHSMDDWSKMEGEAHQE